MLLVMYVAFEQPGAKALAPPCFLGPGHINSKGAFRILKATERPLTDN